MTKIVYNLVAEMVFATSATTSVTLLASTTGFTTSPTDTPANTHSPARLKNAGSFRQEVFTSSRTTGPVKPSWGEIVIENNDGALDSWVDYGSAGGSVTMRRGPVGAAYPAGYETCFIAQVQNVPADLTEIRVRLRDRMARLEGPVVTETLRGTGGLEGVGAAAQQKKPLLIKNPGTFPPVLVDANKQIYLVCANAVTGSTASLFEGGVQVVTAADYTTVNGLLFDQPAPGTVQFYFGSVGYSGPVFFRLGTPPIYDLRVSADGAVLDPSDSIHTTVIGYWTMTDMCRRAGLYDVLPASMPAGANSDLQIPAQRIADDRTYADVLQSAAFAADGLGPHYFGFNRLNQFFCGRLGSPSGLEVGESYAATFTLDDLSGLSRSYLDGMESPVWQTKISSGEIWPGNYATSISPALQADLARESWYNVFSGTSDAVRFRFINAVSTTLETKALICNGTQQKYDFLSRYFLLYGAQRDLLKFDIPLTTANLALKLNDPVIVKIPRFGCDAGRHFRICSLGLDLTDRKISVGVWGGPAFTSTYSLGGGNIYSSGSDLGGGLSGGGIGAYATALYTTAAAATYNIPVTFFPGSAFPRPGRTFSIPLTFIAGAATGNTLAGSLGGSAGRHEIYIAAGSAKPSVTAGCAALATVASANNQPDITTLDFDATTEEYCQFSAVIPKSWDRGPITYSLNWSHAATTTNFGTAWALQAVAVSNDDTIAVAFGTDVTVTKTGGTTNDVYTTDESAALTVAGAPTAGDMVFFRAHRVPSNGSDTLAIDARLHGITLYVQTTAGNDL